MGRDGSPTREDSKSRSHRRDDSESRKDSKRSHKRDRDDRDREVDRNGEKHSEKDRDRHGRKDRESRRSEREKSVDVGKKKDRESRRSEREKSVDEEKKKDRESRRSEKERSVDDYREKHKDRHRERARDKAKERDQEDSVEVENEREKEREREEEKKERAREKEREREREREEEKKERAREKEREREREEEKKERAREKERGREREREEEKKERAREKEREREKAREKEREKEREREREKRERERGREEKDRERSRRRERHRDAVSEDEDVRDHDRKRRRREDDNRERDHEKSGKSRRHGEETEDGSPHKKSVEEFSEKKEARSREEDMEEEQRKLDEEMEKRRRRVQEWQELKRLKEESEREKHGVASAADELTAGKTWTLDGESDDEEAVDGDKPETDMILDGQVKSLDEDAVGDAMAVDTVNEAAPPASQTEGNGATDEEEIDPLDAFMNSMVLPEVEKLSNAVTPSSFGEKNSDIKQEKNGNRSNGEQPSKSLKKSLGRIIPGEDSSSDYEDIEDDKNPSEDEDDEEFMKRVKKTKAEKILIVDHSKIEYPPFRKNFYIEVKEISRMTPEEVAAYRKQLELKIHGKDVPKPVKTWHQMGLSTKIIETIKKLNFEKPMPIQAQALPVIMSGRDCIGVAKTGSGKTLAFVLPMLRHIKDQEPLMSGDGPIGLIMAPTRELVQQIHSDIKKFSKVMGLTCVPVYGGSGVAQQISELKRGAEIVVCTPGRMIDILCTSAGKITNLRRVTYLVMDEADRMFDMGFEPQITRIVQNTQPGRQTVLFSATFPRQVETLARKVLNKPVEIQVGGRSVVNKDITQMVEVRPESERFLRLLELLGEWSEKGKILIFVHTQEKCDVLFRNLLKHGYPCLSLHGAKDQTDRESTISDFKTNVCNLLIATSVAARGLDVKELELVINYDAPNHYEDYVHRVGRTGRAGRKGCAITFISEEDARYAPDLLKALELSEQVIPDDLKALADAFMAKVNQGLEQAHGTGYGGSGFKFNEEEDEVRKAAKKAQAKEYGFEEDKSDSEDENDGVRKAGGDMSQQMAIAAAVAAVTNPSGQLPPNGGLPVSAAAVPGVGPSIAGDLAARATALAAAMNLQHNLAKIQANVMPEHYEAELEINDFAQNARWKVTHKETLGPISEWTGAAITTRGQYYPPGKAAGPGDRKLYLFIEGPTEQSVKRAKSELKRVLEDITTQVSSLPGSAQPGRYSVL